MEVLTISPLPCTPSPSSSSKAVPLQLPSPPQQRRPTAVSCSLRGSHAQPSPLRSDLDPKAESRPLLHPRSLISVVAKEPTQLLSPSTDEDDDKSSAGHSAPEDLPASE